MIHKVNIYKQIFDVKNIRNILMLLLDLLLHSEIVFF